MVVIGILGLLVGILAVAVLPKLIGARGELEIKQMGDLKSGIDSMSIDNTKKRALSLPAMKDISGYKFFDQAFKRKLLEVELVTKIVSLNSPTDTAADPAVGEADGPELQPTNCSYTAPKAQELLSVVNMKGSKKKVLMTFNSRNWNNYSDKGVLIQWSDGPTAVYMMAPDAQELYKIDADTWANKPDEIIGKKDPFDKTFE